MAQQAKPLHSCAHCGTSQTPCWRKGPVEKPILCNACGARYLTKNSLEGYFPGTKCASRSAAGLQGGVTKKPRPAKALGRAKHEASADMDRCARGPRGRRHEASCERVPWEGLVEREALERGPHPRPAPAPPHPPGNAAHDP